MPIHPSMAKPTTPDRYNLTIAATKDILFDVEGHTAAKQLAASGGYFDSEMFTVVGYDWVVRFYPNRYGPNVSIFLVLLSQPKDGGRVGVRFGCAMLVNSGEPSVEFWQSSSHVVSSYGEEWGFWKFAPHDVLEDPDFLVRDCFSLHCTVSVIRKPQPLLD